MHFFLYMFDVSKCVHCVNFIATMNTAIKGVRPHRLDFLREILWKMAALRNSYPSYILCRPQNCYLWNWNIFICPDDHFVLAIVSDFYRHMLAYLARFFKSKCKLIFLSFSKISIFHAKTEILHHWPLLRENSLHTFVV